MMQPTLVWELARKDLLLFLADRRGMLLCFGIPILLAAAFGAIFHRPDESAGLKPRVFLVAESDNQLLTQIRAALSASDRLNASVCDLDTARRRLASEASGVIVRLPAELGQVSFRRRGAAALPRIALWHHPGSGWESYWVEGVVTEVVLREVARATLAPLTAVDPDLRLERPFTVERRTEPAGGALSVHAYSHSFCGMTLQYLLFWGMDSGLLLLRERRQGIWRRLRAAPVGYLTLLSGKALATTLIALAQIGVTFACGAVFFGVTITGSVAGFGLMALAAALLSAATGLLVATLGGNEGRARSVAILVILTLSLLGGLWLPAFLLPAWAQRFGLALPTTWAACGLEGVVWQGMDLAGAAPCALALVGFSALFLAVAWWRLLRIDRLPRPTSSPPIPGGEPCVAALF